MIDPKTFFAEGLAKSSMLREDALQKMKPFEEEVAAADLQRRAFGAAFEAYERVLKGEPPPPNTTINYGPVPTRHEDGYWYHVVLDTLRAGPSTGLRRSEIIERAGFTGDQPAINGLTTALGKLKKRNCKFGFILHDLFSKHYSLPPDNDDPETLPVEEA